jgi:hypothetical protein
MPLILGANSLAGGGYEIDNSLRFNSSSSDNLSRTPASTGNQQIFTLSMWVKRTVKSTGAEQTLLGTNDASGFQVIIQFPTSNAFRVFSETSSSFGNLVTTQLFRDPSAWYHIVVAVDTTQATSSNRTKIYVNGTQITSFSTETYIAQNSNLPIFIPTGNSRVGSRSGADQLFDGYMSEVNFIDGQALDHTSFGEFDEDSGIWKPIAYEGTYGTNGFYLEFKDSSALGDDTSGNSNDFTVNNLTSIDQTTDTPTNNFCTLNPLSTNSAVTLSEGNLEFTYLGGDTATFSTFAVTSGKFYWEIKCLGADSDGVQKWTPGVIGAENHMFYNNRDGGYAPTAYALYLGNGNVYNNNTSISSAYATASQNDIIGVALDMDNLKLYFSKNGTFLNSGDPTSGATGTGAISLSTNYSPYIPHAGEGVGASVNFAFNFGNPPFTITTGNSDANGYGNFEYAVPSGYYALNTKNLSEFG